MIEEGVNTMDELDRLLDDYQEHFEENFPMMLCRTMEDEEIIEIIEKCLENDEPYEPELEDDACY